MFSGTRPRHGRTSRAGVSTILSLMGPHSIIAVHTNSVLIKLIIKFYRAFNLLVLFTCSSCHPEARRFRVADIPGPRVRAGPARSVDLPFPACQSRGTGTDPTRMRGRKCGIVSDDSARQAICQWRSLSQHTETAFF